MLERGNKENKGVRKRTFWVRGKSCEVLSKMSLLLHLKGLCMVGSDAGLFQGQRLSAPLVGDFVA